MTVQRKEEQEWRLHVEQTHEGFGPGSLNFIFLACAGNLDLVVVIQGVLIGVNEWNPALLSFSVIVVPLLFVS